MRVPGCVPGSPWNARREARFRASRQPCWQPRGQGFDPLGPAQRQPLKPLPRRGFRPAWRRQARESGRVLAVESPRGIRERLQEDGAETPPPSSAGNDSWIVESISGLHACARKGGARLACRASVSSQVV